jgi:predicted glycosyltransferase involved in capsule biosynthesis
VNLSLVKPYKNITHLVVIDGNDYFGKAIPKLSLSNKSNLVTSITPFNTGGNGFYGHRILAAYPHLVNHDYILFLDDDNWWDENHVESLVSLCEKRTWTLHTH